MNEGLKACHTVVQSYRAALTGGTPGLDPGLTGIGPPVDLGRLESPANG